MGQLRPGAPIWQAAIDRAVRQVLVNSAAFAGAYPDDCTVEGVYPPRPLVAGSTNHGWTTGFVPGVEWAAWLVSGRNPLRRAGLAHVPGFAERARRRQDTATHDLGFLYTLSCVAAWQMTGDELARATALRAADLLMERFLQPAGIAQAWGASDDPAEQGRTIIDSLMNMPLLFWAAQASGRDELRQAALGHITQLRDHIIRPDGSTFHTFYWHTASGAALRGATQQGHSDDSAWARGQAWGILGFALAHRHTGDASLLRAARRCADYYLAQVGADGVPTWDLALAGGDGQPRDSSAAAIAACGLLELAGQLVGAGQDGDGYRQAAEAAVATLATGYTPAAAAAGGPLLLHGVYDLPRGIGVDAGTLWGDYFYLEALIRLTLGDAPPWW